MIGYYYLGSVYYELYDDTKAIENFEKMLSIAQSKNYPLGKGMYYMFTGLIYSSYEDYDLALENFTKAQPYFEEAHLDEHWIFPNFKENNKFYLEYKCFFNCSFFKLTLKLRETFGSFCDKKTP